VTSRAGQKGIAASTLFAGSSGGGQPPCCKDAQAAHLGVPTRKGTGYTSNLSVMRINNLGNGSGSSATDDDSTRQQLVEPLQTHTRLWSYYMKKKIPLICLNRGLEKYNPWDNCLFL
jgi:hypothetical protein